ncbi:hypothetical protein [Nocardiopsis halophila]|uniref:hypothetical protein n=1 Tax=Nocardiopsis halophila TaxID=141692 RepID=UPI00034C822F|nr:hypothetical protein [Nocardiopsis halophila]
MGAATTVPDPDDARPFPWWVRLSRRLNGERVCAVPGCIGMTDPDRPYCTAHTDAVRALRSRLGDRCCAEEGCPDPREGGDVHGDLCRAHGDAALLRAAVARTAPGRWNVSAGGTGSAGPGPEPRARRASASGF